MTQATLLRTKHDYVSWFERYNRAMQLDVESLRTFLAVLDRGGMTKAGQHLGLSQSAVSVKIKRLEERVGRTLLIRDGHTLRPSRDGRDLLDDARTIVATHDQAVARLRTTDLGGSVRLGHNEEIPPERVAGVLGRFRRCHPATTVEFHVGPTESLAEAIDAGEFDVVVIQVRDDELRDDDVILWTDQLHWVTSAECPYTEGELPLVTFGECCFYRTISEPLLDAAGVDYSVGMSVATSVGVRAAVAAGLGVGILGARYMGDDVVEWSRGPEVGKLPAVHQIARTVPGELPEVACELRSALLSELQEPVPAR